MPILPEDPLHHEGLHEFGQRLRAGAVTATAVTRAYLARIEALDGRLDAFEYLAPESALAEARAIDGLLAAGIDLGPLMGVPVAVKDLFAVNGMPLSAGSLMDVTDLVGHEGSFVTALRRAGCIILGTTRTVEFALGATGVNSVRGTPWNPWDARVHRLPGGSSSGSSVAVAAGLCAFAIGSDTGGSVRLPAAFCGVVGLKTSARHWARDGVFPLAPSFDTIGLLTRSVDDAALAWVALSPGSRLPSPPPPSRLRLGRPQGYFFERLEPQVAARTGRALDRLVEAGIGVEPIEVPEAVERERFFPVVLPVELLASLGRERFLAARAGVDPVVRSRIDSGLTVSADTYAALMLRRPELIRIARERMLGLDAWVCPTVGLLPPPLADFMDADAGFRLAADITRNTQPGNLFDQCGLSVPLPVEEGELPVGLQLMAPPGEEGRALGVAKAVSRIVGEPRRPLMEAFLHD